ncbi:NACHT domain-containing protein [Thalassolituus sp. LLYu03]|uniref:NACHT domain-containing protein n=1 Tax=Thalassolituus sp. LLYu03 TaxID=3421656 RepID=UPI003D275728
MSLAGTRSNRGDYYQKLIALDWVLDALASHEIESLEVDSVHHQVDDIVIKKTDGPLICCQCKKNQKNFNTWSFADLGDELEKAAKELAGSPTTTLIFYSRGAFGDIAKFQEFATNYEDDQQLIQNLTKGHQKSYEAVQKIIAAAKVSLTPFELLERTTFETTPADFERHEQLQIERLERLASNSKIAYESLWLTLEKLGGRVPTGGVATSKHRLTRNDLLAVLNQSGAMLVPPISEQEVRNSFQQTSLIGRSWKTDIAGKRLDNPILHGVIEAMEAKASSILITGQPGSGKTCLMLQLQATLEERAKTQNGFISLFIQSREFSEATNTEERHHQGLSSQWVEQAARQAEFSRVVVIIDSLDVLSIAREHNVLSYFLAQIDRLKNIPNLTVITACRDFDRQYDRRISEKAWDKELKIPPLDWEKQVEPFLTDLDIDTSTIDQTTQTLVTNPRELDLYVELAKHSGSFNVITSQDLAQKYLTVFVQSDTALGDEAMVAVENAARRMLEARALSIPYQQFSGSEAVLRRLLSLGLFQKTHDNGLTFGHQTLLDVLVISNAIREDVSLKEFISGLPPVPFVRPSIRSFVNQLASGEKKAFRGQLRAVLTGQFPFHLRRLVAETFAQQPVDQSDWPLLRDLRNQHKDVFQVIYTHSAHISWFHMWQQNLLPNLKQAKDQEGLEGYLYRISKWLNEATEAIVLLWTEAMDCSWIETNNLARQVSFYLQDLRAEHLHLAKPLVLKLLKNLNTDRDFLGKTIAQCVEAEVLTDQELWGYITGAVKPENLLHYRLEKTLNCRPHQFGNKNMDFLKNRMAKSPTLLTLAIKTINDWADILLDEYKNERPRLFSYFLDYTSYEKIHSEKGTSPYDDVNVLFDAIEYGIKINAGNHTQWWQDNRLLLSESKDLSIIYFLTLALTDNAEKNTDIIQQLVLDEKVLGSNLSFEIGNLINKSIIYFIDKAILELNQKIGLLYKDKTYSEGNMSRIPRRKVSYISAIPGFLRSDSNQRTLDTYKRINGEYIHEPDIHISVRWGRAPFSFEDIFELSDKVLSKVLKHCAEHDDIWMSDEELVQRELEQASSRKPIKYINYVIHYWDDTPKGFRNSILEGVSEHLKYLYGNLNPNQSWEVIEQPDKDWLANQVLEELERHPLHWRGTRAKAKAVEACAYVIKDALLVDRLVFQMLEFAYISEESFHSDESRLGLIHDGINMKSGTVADAIMVLATEISESGRDNSELTISALKLFAQSESSAVKAIILRRLPYLKNDAPELAWEIFERTMQHSPELWPYAESFLYYSYHNEFVKVEPYLAKIKSRSDTESRATWGRVSALSGLSGFIEVEEFIDELISLKSNSAWEGALDVLFHRENFNAHPVICLKGIIAAFAQNDDIKILACDDFSGLLGDKEPAINFSESIFNIFIDSLELRQNRDNNERDNFQDINEWLNIIAHSDPVKALNCAEKYIPNLQKWKPQLYDHNNNLVQLMNQLFAYAEELEESDDGDMLNRVVTLQDALLSVEGSKIHEWLKAAERP